MKNKILVTLATLFACTVLHVSAFAGYQINGITGQMDKVGNTAAVSPFDTTAHGDTTWGSGSSFVWTMSSGGTHPTWTFGNGTTDLSNSSFIVHGTSSQISFANNMFMNGDTARKMKWGSTGGTFNEDLFWDNDTTTNVWAVTSSTGVVAINFGTIGLQNTATNNTMGNVSIGTSGTGASTISNAGNQSIGTAYAVAHAAPTNGLIIQGNVGIGTWITTAALTVNGAVTASSFNATSTVAGSAVFYEDAANGSNYTELKGAASQSSDNTFILPSADGTNGQALVTNGSHTLSFATVSGGGGTAAGGTNAVQYNSGSSTFAGDETKFSFNGGNVGIGTSNATSASLSIIKTGSTKPFAVSSVAGAGGDYLVVTSAGNVGIGTNTPGVLLGVGSTSQFKVDSTGAITALTGITTSGGYTQSGSTANIFTGNIGIGTTAPPTQIWINGTATAGAFVGDGSGLTGISGSLSGLTTGKVPQAASASTLADSPIFSNSTNIGIGTTTAGSLLTVSASDATAYVNGSSTSLVPRLTLTNRNTTASSGVEIRFNLFNSTPTEKTVAKINVIGSNRSSGSENGHIIFSTMTGGVMGERMRIDGTGSVGIGTYGGAPSKLTVSGNGSYGSNTAYTVTSAPTDGLQVQGNVGIGTYGANVTHLLEVGAAANQFAVTSAGALSSAGNVGISTTAPTSCGCKQFTNGICTTVGTCT